MIDKFKLSPKILYYLLAVGVVLLTLLAIGGAVVGNNLLESQSEQLKELKLQREILDRQKVALDQAKQDLDEYSELEQISRQVVPQEKDQVRTVREIANFADQSGINLGLISFPGSDLGEVTATNDSLTQLEPVEGLSKVYVMEVAIQTAEPTQFTRLVEFLKMLESNRRTSQVSNIVISPDPQDRNLLSFTITINIYIKP